MDISLGIRITMSLAIREARSGGSNEIEPGHLPCGLLKLAQS
jgi:hypothetical protein